ncbi:PorP/SprF family type IX secretion system membrane protein [Flavobacterium algicola]|uniref:PorP/SprF family type IX secretion system membrane protein n=1 Tax=Flavobacterium algicola TaxID=556529 RepID=UPI001EFE122B|nr:type IX secretion system membrane protein PorP/SprF [Flavobacterium algicola]MCG9794062.1 type IX secretion system membrane protein PorP/SprF [Flavobacterium algicola]
MKNKIATLITLLVTSLSFAQQDAQFTQYMYNTMAINPAYAGLREKMSIFALHRTQWVGLEGAPVTNNVSIHSPINGGNMGLGLSILNDKIGPSDETDIGVNFSYNIKTTENYTLSFGIKGSVNLLNIDFTKLTYLSPADQSFENNIDNKFSPNVGAGVYYYSDNTYIGFSVPNILETKHFDKYANDGATSYIAKERLHYFLTAGHVFDLTGDIKFKPSLLTKLTQGAPLQVDLSANFLINDKFVIGGAYRWSAAVSGMVGFQVSDSWFIGYGYDLETTRLAHYNSGSHEIFLRYELFNKYDRIVSPRFF